MSKRVIKLAFFKGIGSVLSKSIKLVTNSPYSHTEIIVGENWYGANINFSNKSEITKINKPAINVEEWDIFDIEVTNKQYIEIKRDLDNYVGNGYSFTNLIGYMIGYNVSGGVEFFCSEFATFILKKHKILKMHKAPITYDPGALFNEINVKFRYTAKDKLKIFKGKLTKFNYSTEERYLEWGNI